jgi:hypothetical protein
MPPSSFPKLLLAALVLQLLGCNGYCQSGPKHGTQCHTQEEVEREEDGRR